MVSSHLEGELGVLLRSPLRFDYDQSAAREGHPAAHFSVNSPECRIACVAPVHPYRFIDFVFRHFYPILRGAHDGWFEPAGRRHIGEAVISDRDRDGLHLTWPVH